ncbi:MAG: LysR family transcriptional regulator [Pseudomonadota bacterium]
MSRSLDRLALLETFVRIADAGSISAAARDLGLSQPSVSRQLADLESRLKTQLMRRSTHSLAVTDAGAELLADAREILDGWEALTEKHLSAQTEIRGKLKVVAPVALGQELLMHVACEFQEEHPRVDLTWELEDHPIRFAETGCDCWIKVGPVPDDTLVVRRVGRVERLLVASRQFVKKHRKVDTPKQAEQLPLVALDPYEGGRVPLFQGRRSTAISPSVRMQTNNIFALREAVRSGIGMAILPTWFIADELKKGTLVDMLPGWNAPSLDIHIAYLPGRHPPLRLRAFLSLVERSIPQLAGIKAA